MVFEAGLPSSSVFDEASFDNLDGDEPEDGEPETGSGTASNLESFLTPEIRTVVMPSKARTSNRAAHDMEIKLRTEQAERYLSSLQDLIADKSFQYSHIIRQAPRKQIRTRARAHVAKLNEKISFFCRAYNRGRAALITLGADAPLLRRFRVLTKDDVKASTALRNPNTQGSTTHRLSWIWQLSVDGAVPSSNDGLLECTASLFFAKYLSIYLIFSSTGSLAESPGPEEPLERGGCIASA